MKTFCARGGPGPNKSGSPPALESQQFNSAFLFPLHFLFFPAFHCSLFPLSAFRCSLFPLSIFSLFLFHCLSSIALCFHCLSAFPCSVFPLSFCLPLFCVSTIFLPSIVLCFQCLSAFSRSLFPPSAFHCSLFPLSAFHCSLFPLSVFTCSVFPLSFCLPSFCGSSFLPLYTPACFPKPFINQYHFPKSDCDNLCSG